MKQLTSRGKWKDRHWEAFRLHVHLLLAWGFAEIQPTLATDDEEKISGGLYDAIQNILEADTPPEKWCNHYAIKNESPIPGREGKDRKRTDLIFEYVTLPGRPHYVFEAKPQNYRKDHQKMNYYTGPKGMRRFLAGDYANYTAEYPEIGMLGFILSDTVELWKQRLLGSIERNKTKLRLSGSQEDVHIIDEFGCEWVSYHERDSSEQLLRIYHILIDCKPM